MEENIKSASEWQGTDKYPGIDSYEKVVLKTGTELCALVSYDKNGRMRPCEYLFPRSELERVPGNDVLLNQMLQIAPYKNGNMEEYTYRNEVVVFKIEKDIEVEIGKTEENSSYGMGGMTQCYIPEKHFTSFLDEKSLVFSDFKNGEKSIFLADNKIGKLEYDLIKLRHNQLQMRRNLFCAQSAKLDTLDVLQNSPRQEDVELAKKNIKKIDAKIAQLQIDIRDSVDEIGKVPSPLYDDLNRRLAAEIKCREKGENVLVLGNVKTELSSQKVTDNVLERTNLNVVSVVAPDKVEMVAQNLFKKIDDYDESKCRNDIDVKGQDLVDVMNINRINKDCRMIMAEQDLRSHNFQSLGSLALPTTDGKQVEHRLDEVFTEDSIQKIRSAQNGKLTEPLEMKDGRKAKLMMMGNKANLYIAQPKESLNNVLDQMSLGDTERKRLLNGETIAYKQSHVKLDKDLNCVIAGTVGRLSSPAKTQAHSGKLAMPKRKDQGKKCGHSL